MDAPLHLHQTDDVGPQKPGRRRAKQTDRNVNRRRHIQHDAEHGRRERTDHVLPLRADVEDTRPE